MSSVKEQIEKRIKREIIKKLLISYGLPVFSVIAVVVFCIVLLVGIFNSSLNETSCNIDTEIVKNADGSEATPNGKNNTSSAFVSVDSFVKDHQEAYIKSWGVGGFLPSASIAQTMIETSFSNNVPSFNNAHNMGGVKWSGGASYSKTKELYGDDSVSANGPGTSVGDSTGGSYAYFSSFDAGIVGKAEFMSNQSLYKGAINNTDGISTLNAIADGGWATDPSYKVKLGQLYHSLGEKYKWLDEKAIAEYGDSPVSSSSKVSGGDNSDSEDGGDSNSSKISIDGAAKWFEDREGKVTYSMTNRSGPKSYDCSSSIYYALTENGADKGSGPVSTETEHDWLLSNGYEKIYEGSWSSNDENNDLRKGDIFIWGAKGNSASSSGHTGMFMSETDIIHCSFGNDGIKPNTYKTYKAKVPDHKKVYIYRLKDGALDKDEECGDDTTEASVEDGTGLVPADAKAWGYKPKELPASLKQYIIDPEKYGIEYSGSSGWLEHSGQCVDLTESLGNKIWGTSGLTVGNGWQQVYAWSKKFGNDVKQKPKAGAIFSTGTSDPGHTGIVCHVFEDGSVLIVEQNTPISGITYYHTPNTWNYRLFSVAQQKADNMKFAYSDSKQPKLSQ